MSRSGVKAPLYVVGEATHPGETGKNNEDSYGYITIPVDGNRTGQMTLAIVADGIGGQAAGEEAAQLAVQVVKEYFLEHSPSTNLPAALRQALWDANLTIYNRSRERALFTDMGSTAAVALIFDNDLYVANVGDSRVYLISEDAVTQLSIDHSWGQEAIDAGRITAEEARSHPNRNVLKRYLGITPEVDVDLRARTPGAPLDALDDYRLSPVPIHTGETVLLCSDGLTDLVSDGELATTVRKYRPQQAADRLVALARHRGGHDNITVLILRSGEALADAVVGAAGGGERRTPGLAWGVGALLLSFMALVAVLTRGVPSLASYPQQAGDGVITLPTIPHGTPLLTLTPTPIGASSDDLTTVDTAAEAAAAAGAEAGVEAGAATVPPFATATPARTRTPMPTRTPQPTFTAVSFYTPVAPATAPPPITGADAISPVLGAPSDNDTVRGRVTFRWQLGGPLPPNAAFEVVWWEPQNDANATARAFAAAATDTSLTVDLDALWDVNKTVYWTVLIVQADPYRRLTQPGSSPAWRLNYRRCTERRVCDKIPCLDSVTGRPTTCETNCRTVCN
jgi:PPM family protein phosphatase